MPVMSVKVAVGGELIAVMEAEVSLQEGGRMLLAALADDRSLSNNGQDLEEGEVWIEMETAEGDILSDEPACFLAVDAQDALQMYFGAAAEVVRRFMGRNHVRTLYKAHRAAVRSVVRKAVGTQRGNV
ncbi:hypothetical protein R70006_06294 [Paraburkholderia domus]|uniref:hypothetical protein n=1 Tax=Paraburkholderia domus TaxID=2793075 RepID=UPI001913C43A|nr:hypothetical protein [Paraburkholderia domus]MBK5052924.1 hypothetical protein [Burkholderia sp. R-70006]CAE6822973.1 hypothetical protein R70006_06294 [Paraburkholderia domus]